MNQNNQFFEESYSTHTDVWSEVKERDNVLERWLQSIKPPPGILFDIGCGVARHARIVCENGWRYVGLDKATACVDQAKQNTSGLNAQFLSGDILEISPGVRFDALVDFACFTHFHASEYPVYLAKLNELTRPDCRFLLSVWSSESTGAYGVKFDTNTRNYVVGYHRGVYTRLFSLDDIEQVFGRNWEIVESETVALNIEPVIGLKHLFVEMRRR